MPYIFDESSGDILDESLLPLDDETGYYWTENLCPNPSFEVDLSGWTALTGTTLLQDVTQGRAGHSSMQVETDGTVAGEGVTGPSVTIPYDGTGSMSLYILGPVGNVTMSAVSGDTATIIASTNVTLTGGDYQRVLLTDLTLTFGQQMYIVVQTTTAQTMAFWIDAVQYELNSPAHAYIDGSFPTCQWEGFANESASFQPYQFGVTASGGMFLEGHATPVAVGEVFSTSAEGSMLLTGSNLPAPWSDQDITGTTPAGGVVSYANGVYTTVGGGADIWSTSDQFNYVWQPLVGDGSIVARLTSQHSANPSGGNVWAKAGVMVKQSTTPLTNYAVMAVTIGNGLAFQDDFSGNINGQAYTLPVWLKLTRSGTTVTGYYSEDGTNWTQYGTATVAGLTDPVTIGLFNCAHDSYLVTATFDSVVVTSSTPATLAVSPVGALSDFGLWTPADMDPAVSYAGWSNALASSGQTSWNRSYGLFYPPQQAIASGGEVLWNRAAYMAVGFTYKAVPAGIQQSLADVQVEKMPVVPGAVPAPTGYRPPRAIVPLVKPSRLNYCPNPSIEVSTAGWTVIGTASLSQDNSITAAQGSYSLKVAVSAADDGCYIVLSDLIVGDTYIASAQVQGGAGLEDVLMAVSGASTSSAQVGIPYGGNAILDIGYGQGPYGGVEAGTADMPTGQWFNPSVVFTAQESTVTLSFRALAGSDVSYPTEFWVDAVLVEAGEILQPYFDGSWGTDYSWETGGTSGLTRSYWYDRQEVSTGAVNDVLTQHTPLGITSSAPVFSSPYSQ